jgi:hypothetical protein
MSTPFIKYFQADTSFKWWEVAHTRWVDSGYMYLVEWLSNPSNIPDEVPYVAPPDPPVDPTINERKSYENKYLEATKQLMLLAGETVPDNTWPKLQDTDFATIGLTASINSPGQASFLLSTLNYTLTTLKYDYGWTWEQIEYRPEIV